MPRVWIRLYGSLNDFVPPSQRQRAIERQWDVSGAVKDIIEGLGVPHPEVDLILVNGRSVGFDYLVQDGDYISVYPSFYHLDIEGISQVRARPPQPRFIADAHLGKLAGYLRMLGFDTLYRNDYDDETLAYLACAEERILLSRDHLLLMRNAVRYGYWVRSIWPEEQIREVLQRYDLASQVRPLSRCLRCNTLLEPIEKARIIHLLAPDTRRYYDTFYHCPGCQRIYWAGSHYQRMKAWLDSLLAEINGRSQSSTNASSRTP